jgi:hypothetical protein
MPSEHFFVQLASSTRFSQHRFPQTSTITQSKQLSSSRLAYVLLSDHVLISLSQTCFYSTHSPRCGGRCWVSFKGPYTADSPLCCWGLSPFGAQLVGSETSFQCLDYRCLPIQPNPSRRLLPPRVRFYSLGP